MGLSSPGSLPVVSCCWGRTHYTLSEGGGGDILQLLLILTTGEATYQVRKTKIVTNIKVKGMTLAVVAVVTEVKLINFQIDWVG